MIELTGSTGKLSAFSGATTGAVPKSRISVLRNPHQAGDHKHEIDSDLEALIKQNIECNHSNWRSLTLQIRTFVNSLSTENQKKFLKIVKALSLDKKKHLFVGEIWSGGGMKAIAGSGIGLVLTYVKLLAGLNYSKYIANSAGAFQAAGRAFGCSGSQSLNATIEAPFGSFCKSRSNLEAWANSLMCEAFEASTGRGVSEIKGKHLKETGSTFDVVVGEPTTERFPHRLFSPDIYLTLSELEERLGINVDELSLKTVLGAATNLPGLIFDLFDPTFGNCYIEDRSGNRHFFFDAGSNPILRTPLNLMEEQIERYRRGETDFPKIYFVMDYSDVTRTDIKKLKKEGGVRKSKVKVDIDFIVNSILKGMDYYDWALGNNINPRLRKLGISRTYLAANCAAINPLNREIAVIKTGGLNAAPEDVRETVIGASIPLSDYKDVDNSVIDQFFRNLVDEEFVSSNGERGLSPYELIKHDIDKAIGKNQNPESVNDSQARSTWSIRSLLQKSRAAAAM